MNILGLLLESGQGNGFVLIDTIVIQVINMFQTATIPLFQTVPVLKYCFPYMVI